MGELKKKGMKELCCDHRLYVTSMVYNVYDRGPYSVHNFKSGRGPVKIWSRAGLWTCLILLQHRKVISPLFDPDLFECDEQSQVY